MKNGQKIDFHAAFVFFGKQKAPETGAFQVVAGEGLLRFSRAACTLCYAANALRRFAAAKNADTAAFSSRGFKSF